MTDEERIARLKEVQCGRDDEESECIAWALAEIEQLTKERDGARAEIQRRCQDLGNAEAEIDRMRAALLAAEPQIQRCPSWACDQEGHRDCAYGLIRAALA